MSAVAMDRAANIHVSVREARMWTDRILLVAGVPYGYVPPVRECILLSQSLALGGFAALVEGWRQLDMGAFSSVRMQDLAEGSAVFDGAGLHAWLLLPTLCDLAVDMARRHGRATLQVRHVADARELAVLVALARRQGAVAAMQSTGRDDGDGVVSVTNGSLVRGVEHADPLLHAALRDGYGVDEALWHAMYELSKQALAPDSVVSRRHAGPVILQDDGTILGRRPADDDFDPNMLRVVPADHAGSKRS